MSDWIWALLIGFVLDLLLGDPAWLYHPVCIIGKYISWMEKKLRRRGGNLRKSAVFLTFSTVLLTMAVVALILMLWRRKRAAWKKRWGRVSPPGGRRWRGLSGATRRN